MTSGSGHTPARCRWVIVSASAAVLAIVMGLMVNGFSVFVIPLHAEFGWQRGATSLINTAGLIGLAIGGIVMGRVSSVVVTLGGHLADSWWSPG